MKTKTELALMDVQELLQLAKFRAIGRLTVDEHTRISNQTGVFFDVEIDGSVVTADCMEADDEHGTVVLMLRDAAGRVYRDELHSGPAKEIRRGTVRFVPRIPSGNLNAGTNR